MVRVYLYPFTTAKTEIESSIMGLPTRLSGYFKNDLLDLDKMPRRLLVPTLRQLRSSETVSGKEQQCALAYLKLSFPEVPGHVLQRAYSINQKRVMETINMIKCWIQAGRPETVTWSPRTLDLKKDRFRLNAYPWKTVLREPRMKVQFPSSYHPDFVIEMQIMWLIKHLTHKNGNNDNEGQIKGPFLTEFTAQEAAEAMIAKAKDTMMATFKSQMMAKLEKDINAAKATKAVRGLTFDEQDRIERMAFFCADLMKIQESKEAIPPPDQKEMTKMKKELIDKIKKIPIAEFNKNILSKRHVAHLHISNL